jgi:hypothetical protein
MLWDTGVYDTYTEIPDSLGSSNIYRLIGINSIEGHKIEPLMSAITQTLGFGAKRVGKPVATKCSSVLNWPHAQVVINVALQSFPCFVHGLNLGRYRHSLQPDIPHLPHCF